MIKIFAIYLYLHIKKLHLISMVTCTVYYLVVLSGYYGSSKLVFSYPPKQVYFQHFLQIVLAVMASGPPHVLQLWLGVSKGMLPVKYICSDISSFCVSLVI